MFCFSNFSSPRFPPRNRRYGKGYDDATAAAGDELVDGSNVRERRTDAERFAIAREIAEALKGSFGEIRSAFRAYDVNSDGYCTSAEFGELLKVGGWVEN